MIRLFRIEMRKLFKRRSAWLCIAGLMALPVLLGLVGKYGGDGVKVVDETGKSTTMNGYALTFLTLGFATTFFAPLISSFVAGESLAGEFRDGTLKILLLRPVSRMRIIFVKFAAASIFDILLVIGLATANFTTGAVLFDFGPMDFPGAPPIDQTEAIQRFCVGFGLMIVALIAISALSTLLSTFIPNTAGVIIATLAILIAMRVLGRSQAIKPYLLTTHIDAYTRIFERDGAMIIRSIGALAIYSALFLAVAATIFRKKDFLI